jgi:hypothetical protein
MSRVKLLSILISLLVIAILGLNAYAQDAPKSLGLAPRLSEHQITKVPYSPGILPDLLASTAYCDDAYPGYEWCALTVPGAVRTNIAAMATLYYGGAFDNTGTFYASSYQPNNLVKISLAGVVTVVGSESAMGTNVPTAMAWKQSSGPMYIGAPNSALSACYLYTVNLSTGAVTLVNSITNANGLIMMSINCAGDCYGEDIVADNTVKINLTTGAGTIVGASGVASNYAQGGAFELSSGIFYWAAYDTGPTLRTINITTGASTLITSLTGEYVAFGINGSCMAPQACDMSTGPFVSLPSTILVGQNSNIKAKVTNSGTATQTSIPVKFFVNGVQNGSTQNIASLAPGAFDTNTVFVWNPTASGNTVIKICTALGCDTIRTNDTVTTTVNVGLISLFCDPFTTASNWTITNNGGNCVWAAASIRSETMPLTAVSPIFAADEDLCGSGTTMNTTATLTTPLNCTNATSVYCVFDNDYEILGADHAKLDVSTDGGTTWINKFDWTTDHRTTHETQLLPEANGQASVKVRLTYVAPGWDWWWAVDNFCIYGTVTGVSNGQNNNPSVYTLKQNYPNPFNPTTVISYGLPKAGNVKLVVYDLLGREVKTLVNEFKSAGSYDVTFDASTLASGVYFYRIESGSFTDTKKLTLIK